MRKHDNEAAVAVRELLKADASRERKAAAARSWKGSASTTAWKSPAAAQMRKAMGGAAATPEQWSSDRATPVLEHHDVSGHGTSTSPTPFTNGCCFFNGAGSFFGSAGQSPMAQPWMVNSSDPATCLIQPNLSQQLFPEN